MIRIEPGEHGRLSRARRYALDLVIDLSRLVPAAGDVADAVTLELLDHDIPVGLSGLSAGSAWLARNGRIGIPVRALDLVTDVAGAAIEQRVKDRDRYDRVPAAANPLVLSGLERAPVISQAAVALRRAVAEVADGRRIVLATPWPEGRRWAAAITHDVDVVNWWAAFTALRLAELGRKGEVRRVGSVLASAARSATGDPVRDGVQSVLAAEARHRFAATWFFLTGTPSVVSALKGDLTYLPESPRARWIIDRVREARHEVGLHGSFATYASTPRFQEERARLARLAERPVAGVRQHYLRLSPGETQRAMAHAGFTYDASYGFSSRNGFRLGVADVVPAWDMREDEATGLEEVPLTWMDRALSKYSGIEDPEAWAADARQLMAAAAAVEGLWVGLWHPNLTDALGFPGAEATFAAILQHLAQSGPWVATLDEIVAWRRARRSLRVEAARADGSLHLSHGGSPVQGLGVEDEMGRRVEGARLDVRSAGP